MYVPEGVDVGSRRPHSYFEGYRSRIRDETVKWIEDISVWASYSISVICVNVHWVQYEDLSFTYHSI